MILLKLIASCLHSFIDYKTVQKIKGLRKRIYSAWISLEFGECGYNCKFSGFSWLDEPKLMGFGNKSQQGRISSLNFINNTELKNLGLNPFQRLLETKGPVIIEDYTWIGEMVCIMPGVTIGKGSIIGANVVVTKNIPPYCVAVGTPAHIVKDLR